MGLVRSESANDDQRFRYQPLVRPGTSIRLIEVDPVFSTDGTLQIHLFDSALSEEYTCLSYVWGQENDESPILVNGKTFYIRRNLDDFLHIARTKYPRRRFRIDAICIDQANTPGRNHQVQQMGEIYSGAREVIAWLGCEKLAADFIPFLEDRARHEYRDLPADIGGFLRFFARLLIVKCSSGKIKITLPRKVHQLTALGNALCKYWQRALVTQEIALAKHVCLLVHETEFDMTKLANVRHYRYLFPPQLDLMKTTISRDFNSRGHLLELLSTYGNKKCVVRRDRTYSLLFVCLEGADLHVDYSLSDEKLLRTVLRASHLTPCLCSANIASRSINAKAISKANFRAPSFLSFTIPATRVHTYQATIPKRPKRHPCCSEFSATAFRKQCLSERRYGQLFCLSNVCPDMKWQYLYVVSQESDTQHVEGIRCKDDSTNVARLALGEMGERVEIWASSCGGPYTINYSIDALLKLGGSGRPGQIDKWPTLCDLGKQTEGGGRVRFLGLGPGIEEGSCLDG